MAHNRRGPANRGKYKRRPNRYNPNNPKYYEVHGTMLGGSILGIVMGALPIKPPAKQISTG